MSADIVLDRLEDLFGAFNSGARWRPDMQLDQPSIDGWKKVGADVERQHAGADDDKQRDCRHHNWPPQNAAKQPAIEIAKSVELGIECRMKLREPACLLPMPLMFRADQQPDHNRGQCAR